MATFTHHVTDAPTPAAFLQRRDGYYAIEEIAEGCGQSEIQVLTALRNKRGFKRRTYQGKVQFRRVMSGGRPRLLTEQEIAAIRMRLLGGENLRDIAREIWGDSKFTSERGCYQALKRALDSTGGNS